MITEIALLQVRKGMKEEFITSFQKAQTIISNIKGYVEHSLEQCFEDDHKFLLLVKWESLEDHTIGFRQSEAYKEWKALLHHFYDPFPVVEHFEKVLFAEPLNA
jgi:heme-degrading monooxygenase HmoA